MRDYTFFLDGKDALDYGIQLEGEMTFSPPVPIYEAETIQGKNGDLILETGSFENRTGTAKCFILEKNASRSVGAANAFLLAKGGYRRLENSNDPDHFWLAVVENGVEYENRKDTLIPFEIDFDCKPQRYVKDGEEPVAFTSDGNIFNGYGFTSLPIIKVYGSGEGFVTVGNVTVEILENNGVLILDSETQNAYNDFGNKNNKVKAPAFPVLVDGNNAVSFSGAIEKIEIIPRWWEL